VSKGIFEEYGESRAETRLRTYNSGSLEKVTTHSSILGQKIPWTEEPGGLQSWGHTYMHSGGFPPL